MIASMGRPWWAGAEVKRKAMRSVTWQLFQAKAPKFKAPVIITLACFERDRRRDIDNVRSGATKIIQDALKQMGVIKNDSQRWVRDVRYIPVQVDKRNPRVELEITEAL